MSIHELPAEAKKAISSLALFGLTETLLSPQDLSDFAAAFRIIFSAKSDELAKIADLLEMDVTKLQNNIVSYLSSKGFPCDGKVCH